MDKAYHYQEHPVDEFHKQYYNQIVHIYFAHQFVRELQSFLKRTPDKNVPSLFCMNQLPLYEPHRLKYSQNSLPKIDSNDYHVTKFESSQKYISYSSNQHQNYKSNLLIPGTAKPFENPLKIFGEFAPYER